MSNTMESQDKNEDTRGAYEESPIKLEKFIEILVKIVLLLLLVCIGLLFVILRVVYWASLFLLQAFVAAFSTVAIAFNTPIRMMGSTAKALVTSFFTPIETVTVVLKLACVSVIVSFGFTVEIVRLTVRNFFYIINAFVSIVRYLVGLAFVLMGVIAAAATVSLANSLVCIMLITRVFFFSMIIAWFKYWLEPTPSDDLWTHTVSLLPMKIQTWILWNFLGCLRGVVVKVLNCDIVITEFELQLRYYVHFRTKNIWKRHELSYFLIYALKSTTLRLLQGWPWR